MIIEKESEIKIKRKAFQICITKFGNTSGFS